ncbi:resistin-like [Ornithorhynchus anatinus]|uniref:resistin-like n=1 Tax=Ornithorhynchus anatinus TaxID=9258 RepID=UPI0010A92FFD|nr:resistin-like [Ornithorhynchus anatinus]
MTKAMFLLHLLLLLLPVLGLMAQECAKCTIDSIVDLKIQMALEQHVSAALNKSQFLCTSVTTRGNLASCPLGYLATGCSCGFACGSWDIRSEITCHCQCANMDWTSARCCHLTF